MPMISVPNALAQDVNKVEQFYDLVLSTPIVNQHQFDMREVTWITPYGAIRRFDSV